MSGFVDGLRGLLKRVRSGGSRGAGRGGSLAELGRGAGAAVGVRGELAMSDEGGAVGVDDVDTGDLPWFVLNHPLLGAFPDEGGPGWRL